MTQSKEYQVEDLVAGEALEICFVDSDASPLENLKLNVEIDGESNDVSTDSEGKARVEGKGQTKIKLMSGTDKHGATEPVSEESSAPQSNESSNYPAPFPVLEFRSASEGEGEPLKAGDTRKKLIEDLQILLVILGYDAGAFGPYHVGIDGLFGERTESAVRKFQTEHRDWEGKQLASDGIVGTRTADALNRAMVGILFPKYETPKDLTGTFRLVSATEQLLQEEGIS